MILDKLENFSKYVNLHRNFAYMVEWFHKTDLSALSEGRHDILPDGEIYVNVQENVILKPLDEAKPEFHRKYIDIQVVVQGTESMGWQPLPDNVDELTEFSAEKDMGFLKATPLSWNTVPAGYFTIFMPQDVHSPCCGIGVVRKMIVKVRID